MDAKKAKLSLEANREILLDENSSQAFCARGRARACLFSTRGLL